VLISGELLFFSVSLCLRGETLVSDLPITRSRAITRSPDLLFQLNHLQRTLRLIVLPAHDQVAAGGIVHMLEKIAAFELKFNFYRGTWSGIGKRAPQIGLYQGTGFSRAVSGI
jgi:hypothetical protein